MEKINVSKVASNLEIYREFLNETKPLSSTAISTSLESSIILNKTIDYNIKLIEDGNVNDNEYKVVGIPLYSALKALDGDLPTPSVEIFTGKATQQELELIKEVYTRSIDIAVNGNDYIKSTEYLQDLKSIKDLVDTYIRDLRYLIDNGWGYRKYEDITYNYSGDVGH